MKLLNNGKSRLITSKGEFALNKIIDFSESEALMLLKYPGVTNISDLEEQKDKSEYELLKEKASSLGLEFKANISKSALIKLIEEVEQDSE